MTGSRTWKEPSWRGEGLLRRESILQPGWEGKQQGGKTVAKSKTKAVAVKDAAQVARKDKQSSVVIREANGRIQEERTYPRGSDPRQTKG